MNRFIVLVLVVLLLAGCEGSDSATVASAGGGSISMLLPAGQTWFTGQDTWAMAQMYPERLGQATWSSCYVDSSGTRATQCFVSGARGFSGQVTGYVSGGYLVVSGQ